MTSNYGLMSSTEVCKVTFSFCCFYIYIDGISPNDLKKKKKKQKNKKKQKIFYLTDKLSLHNMTASSGMREMFTQLIFF